jgi:hypothetical protein
MRIKHLEDFSVEGKRRPSTASDSRATRQTRFQGRTLTLVGALSVGLWSQNRVEDRVIGWPGNSLWPSPAGRQVGASWFSGLPNAFAPTLGNSPGRRPRSLGTAGGPSDIASSLRPAISPDHLLSCGPAPHSSSVPIRTLPRNRNKAPITRSPSASTMSTKRASPVNGRVPGFARPGELTAEPSPERAGSPP